MKKLICLFIALCLSLAAFATVRTVSSNPSTLGQHSNIQAAVDISNDGDTIYVYGSPNTYPSFTIVDKRLTIIGPGWAPDKNIPLQAIVSGCILRNTGGAGSPAGSELQGIVFVNPVTLSQNGGGSDSGFGNLRLIRCQFNSSVSFHFSASDVLFEGCVFYNSLIFETSMTYQNFLIQNNMFFFSVCCLTNMVSGLTNAFNVRFDHNLFYSSNNGTGANVMIFSGNCRFLDFSNNIFNQANVGENVSLSTFNNNITNNATLNSAFATSNGTPWAVNSNVNGGGNITNQNPQMADQSPANAGNGTPTLNFTIAAGPANTSGSDGKDMGLLFDSVGSLNWTNSRNSRLPRIYSMNITTPTVAAGSSLSVTVEARKSN
ncbi:MAG TPA: hypothetical protein VGK59_20115 [Ohtaekwangia sp.]